MTDDVVINPNDQEDENAQLGQEIWLRAAGLTIALRAQSGDLNPVIVCLAGMLLSVRTAKHRRALSFDEFVAQARNVWESGMADLSDDDLIDVVCPPTGPTN